MSHAKDWIPGREKDLVVFLRKWRAALSDAAKRAAYGWDAVECGKVVSLIDDFLEALEAYEADDSSGNLLAKNVAKKAVLAGVRAFANAFVRYNPKMSEVQKADLGIFPADPKPTPVGVPTIHVGFTLEILEVYELRLRFWVLETGEKAVPPNMNGVVVYQKVSDTPITDQAELTKTKLHSNHISTLHFAPQERGKMVYVACRWESDTGDEGEWSPIQSFMVP